MLDVLTPRLNLDFAWDSVINFLRIRMTCARSTNVALGILGPINEHSEENHPNTSEDSLVTSDPSVSLHALTVKLSRNSLFNLG